MKNILLSLAASTLLGACGFMTPAKQYAGDLQSLSNVAVIKGFAGKPFSDDFHATIRGYSKLESSGSGDQKQFGIHGFTDFPSEIQVLAGEYKVYVYCFNGFTSYRPTTVLPMQVGKTYLLQCEVHDGQALIVVQASDNL